MSDIYDIFAPVHPSDENVVSLANIIKKGSKPIEVDLSDELLPFGNCYWNADFIANKNNWAIIIGWVIWQWPNSHLSATHHAVVKDENGKLIDVTRPSPSFIKSNKVTFIEDPRVKINLQKNPAIGNYFKKTSNIDATDDYFKAYRHFNEAEKKLSQEMFNFGLRCEDRFITAKSNNQTPLKLDSRDISNPLMRAFEQHKILGDKLYQAATFLKSIANS